MMRAILRRMQKHRYWPCISNKAPTIIKMCDTCPKRKKLEKTHAGSVCCLQVIHGVEWGGADESVGASKDTKKWGGNSTGVSGPTSGTRADLDCPRKPTHDKKHPVPLGY